MLLKPYTILDDERRNPFALKHIGTIVDNNDPQKRKRVRVQIDLWNYLEDEELPWVKQEGDGAVGCSPSESTHHIPEVGSEVTVYFKNSDPNDPVYTGVETTEANRCTLFDEGYPNTYGTKDSVGNYEIVNKETKTTVKQYASGTTVRAEEDGTYTISTKEGNTVKIDGNGEIYIQGPKIHILAEDEIEMRATRIDMVAQNAISMSGTIARVTGTQLTDIKGGSVQVGSKSDVNLTGKNISADNMTVKGGATSDLIDIVSKGSVYSFRSGILTSVK